MVELVSTTSTMVVIECCPYLYYWKKKGKKDLLGSLDCLTSCNLAESPYISSIAISSCLVVPCSTSYIDNWPGLVMGNAHIILAIRLQCDMAQCSEQETWRN